MLVAENLERAVRKAGKSRVNVYLDSAVTPEQIRRRAIPRLSCELSKRHSFRASGPGAIQIVFSESGDLVGQLDGTRSSFL